MCILECVLPAFRFTSTIRLALRFPLWEPAQAIKFSPDMELLSIVCRHKQITQLFGILKTFLHFRILNKNVTYCTCSEVWFCIRFQILAVKEVASIATEHSPKKFKLVGSFFVRRRVYFGLRWSITLRNEMPRVDLINSGISLNFQDCLAGQFWK